MFTLHIFLLILSLNKSLKFILSMLIILYLWDNAVIKEIKIGLPDFYVLCYFDFLLFLYLYDLYDYVIGKVIDLFLAILVFFLSKNWQNCIEYSLFLLLIQLYVLYVLFSYATFMDQCCNKKIKILFKKFNNFCNTRPDYE